MSPETLARSKSYAPRPARAAALAPGDRRHASFHGPRAAESNAVAPQAHHQGEARGALRRAPAPAAGHKGQPQYYARPPASLASGMSCESMSFSSARNRRYCQLLDDELATDAQVAHRTPSPISPSRTFYPPPPLALRNLPPAPPTDSTVSTPSSLTSTSDDDYSSDSSCYTPEGSDCGMNDGISDCGVSVSQFPLPPFAVLAAATAAANRNAQWMDHTLDEVRTMGEFWRSLELEEEQRKSARWEMRKSSLVRSPAVRRASLQQSPSKVTITAPRIVIEASEDADAHPRRLSWHSEDDSPSSAYSNPSSAYSHPSSAIAADVLDELVESHSGYLEDMPELSPEEDLPGLSPAADALDDLMQSHARFLNAPSHTDSRSYSPTPSSIMVELPPRLEIPAAPVPAVPTPATLRPGLLIPPSPLSPPSPGPGSYSPLYTPHSGQSDTSRRFSIDSDPFAARPSASQKGSKITKLPPPPPTPPQAKRARRESISRLASVSVPDLKETMLSLGRKTGILSSPSQAPKVPARKRGSTVVVSSEEYKKVYGAPSLVRKNSPPRKVARPSTADEPRRRAHTEAPRISLDMDSSALDTTSALERLEMSLAKLHSHDPTTRTPSPPRLTIPLAPPQAPFAKESGPPVTPTEVEVHEALLVAAGLLDKPLPDLPWLYRQKMESAAAVSPTRLSPTRPRHRRSMPLAPVPPRVRPSHNSRGFSDSVLTSRPPPPFPDVSVPPAHVLRARAQRPRTAPSVDLGSAQAPVSPQTPVSPLGPATPLTHSPSTRSLLKKAVGRAGIVGWWRKQRDGNEVYIV